MWREVFAELEKELTAACLAAYGPRLVSLAVFGSVARGTAGPESDLDLLLVAEQLPRGRGARVREFLAVEQRMEAALAKAASQGVHTYLAPVFRTPEEAARGSVLFWDMTQEVHILYDPHRFLENLLAQVRGKLQALGAKRIAVGTGYFWDLKPDFRPGEEFEL